MMTPAFYLSLIVFLVLFFSGHVGSEIVSLNGKYSSRRINGAHSIETRDGILRSKFRSGRHIRSASEGATGAASNKDKASNDSTIAISKFDLLNTEDNYHVHVSWMGENSTEKIFILTVDFEYSQGFASVNQSLLWCSDDHGETFHVREFSQDVKISFMYTFPSNSQKMIFTDTENKMIYTSEDELAHNSSHRVPIEPDVLVPHPANESKLLIYSYIEQKLYGSDDFGASWTFVAEGVIYPFFWGDPDFDASEDVVHIQIEGEMPSQAIYKACLLPGCQPVPGDLDEVGPFMTGSLLVYREYMLVQRENQDESEVSLMVSYSRGRFNRAQFPSNEKTSNFMILNLDDGQVFVAVHHENVVNLYLSDVTGQYYVLSLAGVFHDEKFDWFSVDMVEVRGMNWTFMANKHTDDKTGSSPPGSVQTYVSYDKGGNWAPLRVSRSCTKAESCALLLELQNTFELDPIKSVESAPGIIIGHGMVGKYQKDSVPSVFVTNDGGATWKQAPLNHTCILRILNHGSVLTAIPDVPSSKIIYYSLDHGTSWHSQKFDDTGFSSFQMLPVEQGGDALVQSILGRESKDKPLKYVKLNMMALLPNKCDPDDYEIWSPKDYNGGDATEKCILGRVVQYTRRKATAICYSEKSSASYVPNNSTCLCTDEDYECDFGFEKRGDACHKSAWFSSTFVPAECDDGGDYNQSQGYRKIPADICIENEEDKKKYDRKKTPCPSAAPLGLSVMTQMNIIPLGKRIVFYLEQTQGSKWDTNYTWDFGDASKKSSETGFKNSAQKQHAFQTSGKFNITVTATNKNGQAKASLEVYVLDRLTKLQILAPWASVVGHAVKIHALAMSSAQILPTRPSSVHYLWSFGDEASGSRPLLSWNSSMSHEYAKAGTYNIKIEASNSISSVSDEFPLKIFESAVVLELHLEGNSKYLRYLNYSYVASILAQSLRQQVAQDLGLNVDRLEAILPIGQRVAYLYLFPANKANEMSVKEIKEEIIDKVKKGLLDFGPFGTHLKSKDLIKVVSAKEVSGPPSQDKKSGPNLKPLFIAIPVLALVLMSSLFAVSVFFYRKKRSAGARYSMFGNQDESDRMLDDDVAPLNMNLEISEATSSRDESLLDSGPNVLVMETGGGVGGNEEVC